MFQPSMTRSRTSSELPVHVPAPQRSRVWEWRKVLHADRRTLKEYALALAVSLLALQARFALDPFLGDHLPFVTFFIAVMITTWYGGLGPSLAAVLLGGLASNWFFMSRQQTLSLIGVHQQVGYVTYFLVSLAMVGFGQALRRAQEAAVVQKHWLEMAEQSASVGAFEWNIQTGRNTWSVGNEALYGLQPGQFTGTFEDWAGCTHPDDREAMLRASAQSGITGAPFDHEFRVIWPNGEIHWLHGRCTIIRDQQGRPHRMIGINTDITDRKKADKALRDSEERYRHTFANAAVGIAHMGLDGRWLRFNDAVCRITGYAREELQGKSFADMTHPDDIEPDWAGARKLLAGELDTYSMEKRYIRKDGGLTWVHLTVSLQHDEAGVPLNFISVINDITDRKRVEDALRQNEHRLCLALEAGRMGAWDVDLRTNATQWDAKEFALLGLTAGTVQPSPEAFYRCVYPDDVSTVERLVEAAMSTGVLRSQFRVIHPDGQVRWLACEGQIIQDASGQPIRMVGVNHDVTDRVLAEEKLLSSAHELELRVQERTQDLLESQERLRALATELNLAEQRERKRLTIELHDHLQQTLVLGKIKIGQAKRLPGVGPGHANILEQVDRVVSEALTYTRTLVAELSPPVLREHGLAAGLTWLAEYMTKHDLVVAVTVPQEVHMPLPEDQAVLLFQSVRELLINSAKHAGTGRASVCLEIGERDLRIEVKDEGTGFDLAVVTGASRSGGISSKFGLSSIGERMKAFGGSFEIQSSPGQGTTATISLPVRY